MIKLLSHLSFVAVTTPDVDASVDFYVNRVGLTEVAREDDRVYLRCWGDYYSYSLVVVRGDEPALDTMAWRTSSAEALEEAEALVFASGMAAWTSLCLATLGAGEGQFVLVTQGSSASLTPETKTLPIDAVVIGLVDSVRIAGREILVGATANLPAGRRVGLVGRNGAGKTTTLRLCLGLTDPDGGSIDMFDLPVPQAARQARARVGVVPQMDNLDPDFTVYENLRVYGRYFGLAKAAIEAVANQGKK